MTTIRPFSGKLLPLTLGFPKTKLCIKFEVPSSIGFEDMFDRMPKILGSRNLSHAPFGESYLCIRLAFHMRRHGPNLQSLAQIVLKIIWIVCQKIERSRYLGHAPFGENYLCARLAFTKQR